MLERRRAMNKTRYFAVGILTIVVVGTVFYMLSIQQTTASPHLEVKCEQETNVVDKRQGEAFTIKVKFKNMGNVTGTWNVNVAFEGESNWSWQGTPQTLTLKPSKTATLTWTGTVPVEAEVDSTARLIVYFDNEVEPQDWWIHVVPGAELKIIDSEVS